MAASRTTDPLSGAPLELRDSRLASNTFRLGTNSWDGVPKPKFLFYVRFMRSQSTGGTGSSSSTVDWSKGVGLVVKNVDRPKVAFDTQTLNQYNRKRVVQSRVEYNPLSIKFHDTVDNKVFNMFEEYFRFYYGDPRATSDVNWQWDQYAAQLKTPGSGNWGFNPPAVDPNFSYFFSRVEIYQFFGGKFARFDIINPKIVSFDPDELDYANGSLSHEVTMNLAFEGIVYQGNNQDLASNSDLLEEMKLNGSDYYLPAQSGSNAGGTTATSATYTPTTGSTFDNTGSLALGSTNSLPSGVLSTSLSNTGNVAAPAIAAPPLMSNIGGNLYYGDAASSTVLGSDGTLQRVFNTGVIGSTNFSSDPVNAAQRLVWGLL